MQTRNSFLARLDRNVTVIVVNWNGQSILASCLESLARQTYSELEIIVVDNGSKDGSVRTAKTGFPDCKVLELGKNEGFTGGNAKGLELSIGQFIALVNNDARVKEDWLEQLIQPMFRDVTVGICASKLIFDDGVSINSAGDGITTGGVGYNRGLGSNVASYDKSDFVFSGCGAAVLYRRQMLEEIGFLDEDFFLYDEDTDLSFRAQLAGWKCAYVADAIAYHKSNTTAGRLSDTHVYYHTRNLEFVWIKNMPLALMFRFAHHKLLQEIGSFCYLCLRHGKWWPYLRAKWDALRMLPRMWRKRRPIQENLKVSNAYVCSLMTSMLTMDFALQKIRQMIRG